MPTNNEEVIGGFGDGDNGGENTTEEGDADNDFPDDPTNVEDGDSNDEEEENTDDLSNIIIDDGSGDGGSNTGTIVTDANGRFTEEYKEQLRA